jgi:hypothetical protein
MSSQSLKSAVREIARLDPADAKKVQAAVTRLSAALDEQVAARVEVSVAKAFRRLNANEPAVEAPVLHGVPGGRRGRGRTARTGLAGAVKSGDRFRDETWASPEMLSSDEAAALLNMSREALNKRRQAGRALGLEVAKRGVRYPRWQFEDRVQASVTDVLAALSHLDAWGHYLFFTRREPLLGETPLEVIRRGNGAEALRVARLLADDAR